MRKITITALLAIATLASFAGEKTASVSCKSDTYPLTYEVYSYAKGVEYLIYEGEVTKTGIFKVNVPFGDDVTIVFHSDNETEMVRLNGNQEQYTVIVKFKKLSRMLINYLR